MKQVLCLILSFILFTACGDLSMDDKPRRRDDDREGEVELPNDLKEKLTFKGFLQNCKPEVSLPDNTTDIFLDIFGLSKYYPPKIARECLKVRLEDGHNRICDARDKLERKRKKARSESAKARVDNALDKLDQIQFKFNQNLHELAVRMDDNIKKVESKQPKNDWGRFVNWYAEDEAAGLRDILDTESYSECNFYRNDDDE